METQQQTKVEYAFLEVDTDGEIMRRDGQLLKRGMFLNDWAADGWRFVTIIRPGSERQHPIFLMQIDREAK